MFEETFRKSNDALLKEAEYYFEQAYHKQVNGNIPGAMADYKKSIEIFPTAEAHTFLGWALSHHGDYEAAITECEEAIAVDPDFGNPYNDIGAYLIRLHRYEDAVPWLEKAKEAKRYEARHYPYFNLGRIKEMHGDWFAATIEYETALALYPQYELAKESLHRVKTLLARRN
jgi:tetratricopeptide (TPR) repeat protein